MTSTAENDALDRKIIKLDRSKHFTLYRDLETISTKIWLVKNLLGHAEASAFYGAPGSGKSALVEDMGLHIAGGLPWHDRDVNTRDRLLRCTRTPNVGRASRHCVPQAERHIDTRLPILGGVYDFRVPATAATVASIIRQIEDVTEQKTVLIIIDTISRALNGGDETHQRIWAQLSPLRRDYRKRRALMSHGCIMCRLTPGRGFRGHGALLGALDTTINVEKLTSGLRTATVIKANDTEEGERIAFTLDSVTIGPETTAPVVVPFDGEPPKEAPSRKLPARYKLARENLTDLIADKGQPAPAAFGLPSGVRVVNVTDWRDELFARGVLDKDAANPREDFLRIKANLQARHLVAERDALVWLGS